MQLLSESDHFYCYFCCIGEGTCFGQTQTIIGYTELDSTVVELQF